MIGYDWLILASQVKKMLLSATLPALRSLRAKGKTYKRTRACGARGRVTFQDCWKWPKGQGYLFPNRLNNGHLTKDIACHAIVKARMSFTAPKGLSAMLDTSRIRTHSGRHRMINDLKSSGVPTEAAMLYARIKDRKTFDKYGQLDQEQSGKLLNRNQNLKRTLKQMYS